MNLFKNCFQIFSLLLRSTFSSEQGFSGCVGMIKDHQNNSEKYCVKLHRNKKKKNYYDEKCILNLVNSNILSCC